MRNRALRAALVAVVFSPFWTVFTPRATAADDRLVLISPHRKSLQQEFVPTFEAYYKNKTGRTVVVEWVDQGGTSDDIRFIRSKFAASKGKTSGLDVFWGGGATAFIELEQDKFLDSISLPKDLEAQLPKEGAGISMRGKNGTWFASALSSFGIFYNPPVIKLDKLPTPATWDDLGDSRFLNSISQTDARRSGSYSVIQQIILESKGWDEGWKLLTRIAGNTRSFAHSSSDPIKAVVSGDAAAAMAIDFYAYAKIEEVGKNKLAYVIPDGQSVIDPDPVGVLKGAPNKAVAQHFVEYVLSNDAQKLYALPVKSPGGPKFSSLLRMPVNTQTYADTEGKRLIETNPFKAKPSLKLNYADSSAMTPVINDLTGAVLVDVHTELKDLWAAAIKKGKADEVIKAMSAPPVSRAETLKLAGKWKDEIFRNKQINEWVKFAREKFKKVHSSL